MKALFVSGTDTEVGKTWVSSHILQILRQSGYRVGAWKPVCSGAIECEGRQIWQDIQALANAVEGHQLCAMTEFDSAMINRICAQRFELPMAPNMAARYENRTVSDDHLMAGPEAWIGHAELVLIEGAGGLLSPASDTMLGADLAAHLKTPILLVAANRLGTIHQTLATVEAARARDLSIVGVVLNEAASEASDTLKAANESELRRLLPDIRLLATSHNSPQPLQDAVSEIQSWFAEM